LAERLRVRRSCSVERVVGQSGSLTNRRPRVVSSVGGVDVVVRSRMLNACCTQHAPSQSHPAAVGVTLFPNCRSCVVTPQGRRSTSADPEGTYVVLASGCGANSWPTRRARGRGSPHVVWFGDGPFVLLWRRHSRWLLWQLDRAERLCGPFFVGCWQGIGSPPPLWRRPGDARAGSAVVSWRWCV